MTEKEIIERCVNSLDMSESDAQWVASNLDRYAAPDFSEASWEEIDETFRSVLFFKEKTDRDIEEFLSVSQ